ncbi:ATP-binding protein [Trichothermofontia sp.]
MENTWTLLIVDDSPADRAIYRRYLSQDLHHCYTIFEANCAEECLTLCQQQAFDLILLDFRLPDQDGLHVLAVIRTLYPQTVVIMLTGHGDEQIAVSAMKGGAQDYLVKDNLEGSGLQRTVRNAMHQALLQQQLREHQERQRLIIHIAFRIRQSLNLEETLQTAVTEVRQLLQCDRVFAYQFFRDMSGQIIAESVGEGWSPALGQVIVDTYFQSHGIEAYRGGRKQVIADIYTANLDACHIALLERFEAKASLVIPILIGDKDQEKNQLWGLLGAHQCSGSRQWKMNDIHILDELSVHLAIAIQHAEFLAKTQAALEKEKNLAKFKSQIIATVSHEYNSPLAAIQAAAATLKAHHQYLDIARQVQILDIIEQKSKHLSLLVKDMLLVNQADLGKLQLKPMALDLEETLAQVIVEQQVFDRHQHEIVLSVRGNIAGFSGDRGLLRQVFVNLLSNAVKYSPKDSCIQIKLIGEANQVRCLVRDQGIGIPKQDMERLFQPFNRGSNVGTIAGTGLGLQIVKIVVELHGGTITLASQEGKGTRVMVCLPKQPYGDRSVTTCTLPDQPQTTLHQPAQRLPAPVPFSEVADRGTD